MPRSGRPTRLTRSSLLSAADADLAWAESGCFDLPLEEIQRRERALGLLKEYNDLYGRMARARPSAFDLQTVMKLIGSLLLPIVMLAMRNRVALSKLLDQAVGP